MGPEGSGQTVDSRSAEDTEAVGRRIAAELRPGDVVLVTGELGAGKTTLVRGAARALGVEVPVTSPTFTIGQRYPARPPLAFVAHIDLYRVASLEGEDPDLLADYAGPDTVTFVEWPEGAEAAFEGLARIARRVHLAHAGSDRRRIEIT